MFNIKLDRNLEQNLYNQIYEAIRAEILSDQYTPDTKMPSIRKLSSRLNVNTETVVKAYDLLAAENLIYKKEGSGSYIAPAAALKNDGSDQRLRILSSKSFSAPSKKIDLSGIKSSAEFLEEYSWDLIFDRFYSEFKGKAFENRNENSYFEMLQNQHPELAKEKLFYASKEELDDILASLFSVNSELLFTDENNISQFKNFLKAKDFIFKKDEQQKEFASKLNLHLSSADYESLMDYLEENQIDYLLISDESLTAGVLDWSLSKLKSLLELSKMLNFKLIILEYFSLYQKNSKLNELLASKFKDQIILIQAVTERIFPGLKTGIVYLEADDFKDQSTAKELINRHLLSKYLANNYHSVGENLVYNLLAYYLDNNYLAKRIKFLKQRLKNKSLLLSQNIKEHFRGAEIVKSESLFFIKLILNQKINQHDFKVFAEKNSILIPDYKDFSVENKSKELIISPVTLDQFSIKQGVMALAKVYWQFIS